MSHHHSTKGSIQGTLFIIVLGAGLRSWPALTEGRLGERRGGTPCAAQCAARGTALLGTAGVRRLVRGRGRFRGTGSRVRVGVGVRVRGTGYGVRGRW